MARNPAGENFSPETLNMLPDFPARASITTQSSGPGLASILYADTDAPLRGFAVQILTSSGYAVTPVQDGLLAWEALHSEMLSQSFSHITPYRHWGINE